MWIKILTFFFIFKNFFQTTVIVSFLNSVRQDFHIIPNIINECWHFLILWVKVHPNLEQTLCILGDISQKKMNMRPISRMMTSPEEQRQTSQGEVTGFALWVIIFQTSFPCIYFIRVNMLCNLGRSRMWTGRLRYEPITRGQHITWVVLGSG